MKNNNPKYAFYYFLSLVALIFLAVSSVLIVFQIIDKSIVDILSYGSYSNQSTLRFSISAILISAPIFFLTVNLINRGLRKKEIEKDSSLRNWLTYFILFVSAVIILGSLIGTINSFLSGEITLKFVLQIITLITVSALIFSFYLYDIKRENILESDKVIKAFFISALSLVIIVFISSWFFVESPKTARERRMDSQIVNSIYTLENYVNTYYREIGSLPESIEDLKNKTSYTHSDSIEYKKLGEKEFEICADFKTDSYEFQRPMMYPEKSPRSHSKGYNCFNGSLWSEAEVK